MKKDAYILETKTQSLVVMTYGSGDEVPTFSSALTVRMLVSFFSRTGFTSRSLSRAHSPTTCSVAHHQCPEKCNGFDPATACRLRPVTSHHLQDQVNGRHPIAAVPASLHSTELKLPDIRGDWKTHHASVDLGGDCSEEGASGFQAAKSMQRRLAICKTQHSSQATSRHCSCDGPCLRNLPNAGSHGSCKLCAQKCLQKDRQHHAGLQFSVSGFRHCKTAAGGG